MKTRNYIVPLIFASPFLMAPLCSDSDFVILEQETAGLSDGGDGLASNEQEDNDTAYEVDDKLLEADLKKDDDDGFHYSDIFRFCIIIIFPFLHFLPYHTFSFFLFFL